MTEGVCGTWVGDLVSVGDPLQDAREGMEEGEVESSGGA